MITKRGGKEWEVGERFKWKGKYVYLLLIRVAVWQKPTQYCKATILQIKINFKKSERDILEVIDMFMA